MRRGDLDLRQLGAGGAVLVHVALRGERIPGHGHRPERRLEPQLGRLGDPAGAADALARQRHQRDAALALGNRAGRVADVAQVRGAAGVGRVQVGQLQAQVLGHRDVAHAQARRRR